MPITVGTMCVEEVPLLVPFSGRHTCLMMEFPLRLFEITDAVWDMGSLSRARGRRFEVLN